MKKIILITITCAFCTLFICCKENSNKTQINSKSIKTITLSSIKESFSDTSCFKNPQIVILETTEESLLSEITRIAIDDSTLFIYDNLLERVLIFSSTGKYISKIDCKGEGPNEYAQTTDFTIDTSAKQIILLCATPRKRMYFNYKGELIKQEKNSDYFSFLMADENYIYFENISGRRNNQLYILDPKTNKIKEVLKTTNIKTHCFPNGNSISRGKNILYVRRFDNTIYELKNGDIIKRYLVDFKEHSFPEYFLTEENDDIIEKESRTHNYIYSMSNVTENDHYMMFNTNCGLFLYDKRKDVLTGYKRMENSKLNPIANYSFSYFSPLENTNMIACAIDEPMFIKDMAEFIIEKPNHKEVKEIQDKYPGLSEEIVNMGNLITEENNPVLFIYEFKD